MTRSEFNKKTEHYHGRIGDMDIVLDDYCSADFIIGCYYDKKTKTWKVYETYERGMGDIRLETTSEGNALNKLYSMIEVENERYSRYKELEAKKKKQE